MPDSASKDDLIVRVMRGLASGSSMVELCAEHGVSKHTVRTWKRLYGGMKIPQVRRALDLEAELASLDMRLAKAREEVEELQCSMDKSRKNTEERRACVEALMAEGLSERRACDLANITRSSLRYEPLPDPYVEARKELVKLADKHPTYGCRRLHALLIKKKRFKDLSLKVVERLYREEDLVLQG